MRIDFKVLISICAGLVLLGAFQNCGRARSSSPTQAGAILQTLSKSVVEISYDGFILKADGSVMLSDGSPFDPGPGLRAHVQNAVVTAELCAYIHPPLPPDTAVCMAFPMPYASASTDDGERVDLSRSICNVDTTDLCPASAELLRGLASELRQALQAP